MPDDTAVDRFIAHALIDEPEGGVVVDQFIFTSQYQPLSLLLPSRINGSLQ